MKEECAWGGFCYLNDLTLVLTDVTFYEVSKLAHRCTMETIALVLWFLFVAGLALTGVVVVAIVAILPVLIPILLLILMIKLVSSNEQVHLYITYQQPPPPDARDENKRN